MIQLLNETWEIVVALWNTGIRFARLAIRMILSVAVVWLFVLLGVSRVGSIGFTSAMALVPLAAVLMLVFIYPLVSGVLAAFPQGRTFYAWLVIVLFGEMVVGLYLAAVPVWNNPKMIPLLALLVATLGMWMILRRLRNWRRGGWFAKALVLAIVGVTISFFFVGKEEAGGEAARQTASQKSMAPWTPQPFEFAEAGEYETAWSGPGIYYEITPNKPWVGLSIQSDGSIKEYKMPAKKFCWKGGGDHGHLRVKVEAGTVLLYQRKKEA